MAAIPDTVYARDGDVHLAYQIVGDSGQDLLFVPTATFPIDLLWDEPTVAGHLRRLASFSRLIAHRPARYGKLRCGAGARPSCDAGVDRWAGHSARRRGDRVRVGVRDGGVDASGHAPGREPSAAGAVTGAMEPVRVLPAHSRRTVRDVGVCGARYIDAFGNTVGTGATVDLLAPSWAGDAAKRRWWARGERLAGGPGYFKAVYAMFLHTDVRPCSTAFRRRR